MTPKKNTSTRRPSLVEPPWEYLFKMPTVIPAGKVLVHNHVRPTRRSGSRGFRIWLSTAEDRTLERCDYSWAPELGPHFRRRPTKRIGGAS